MNFSGVALCTEAARYYATGIGVKLTFSANADRWGTFFYNLITMTIRMNLLLFNLNLRLENAAGVVQ